MDKPKVNALKFAEERIVYYPALRRHVPRFVSPLAPYASRLIELRNGGWTIEELRNWVHGQSGWKPGERAMFRLLAKRRELR